MLEKEHQERPLHLFHEDWLMMMATGMALEALADRDQ